MTQVSRRAVLKAGALAAAALPFASNATADASTTTTSTLYGRSRFTPYINKTFTLTAGTSSWTATLTGVGDLPGAPAGDQNRFSLAFRTTSAGPGQQTCTLRRSGFTATPLFVVPSGAATQVYNAIVNRIT